MHAGGRSCLADAVTSTRCAATLPISRPDGRVSTSGTTRSGASQLACCCCCCHRPSPDWVLAGTDLFYPPIGAWIAGWVAAPGVDPATRLPYTMEMYDETAYAAMRAFRKPFITVHYYGFYVLLAFALLHILAVVVTEVREGGNLISAMFSGKKILSEPPADRTKVD